MENNIRWSYFHIMKINFLARNLDDNTHYVKADNFRSKTLNFVQ